VSRYLARQDILACGGKRLMASVRKRKWTHAGVQKEAWVVTYTDQGGKRRLKTFEKKKDADRFRTQVETEIEAGQHTPDSSTRTVRQVCEEHIRALEQQVKDDTLGQSRCAQVRMVCDLYISPTIGSRLFNGLTFADGDQLHKAMGARGISLRSAKHYLHCAKQLEAWAKKRGYTAKTPLSDYYREVRAGKTVISTFMLEDVKKLLVAIETLRHRGQVRTQAFTRCAVYLAAFCGLRHGEIMALQLEDVDWENSLIKVRHSLTRWQGLKGPKSRAGVRDIPAPPPVLSAIRLWLDSGFYVPNEANLVFRSKTGKGIRYYAFWAPWKTLLKEAGLSEGLHFHALRHFAASNMIVHGIDLPDVASLMGHATFDMTLQVYTHAIVGGNRRSGLFDKMAASLLDAPKSIVLVATIKQQETITY
jgi:integrase